ncbi:uncharacterized protein LOC126796735 [Argentina anserina]|uniref:uncharacterized protein LOC126796735 n=1 Tax=Argentina anserina TaxID=57926 RepID=UPI00217656D6|nr:uncharacterized protein LOC126796735 [Potentilla anserina]
MDKGRMLADRRSLRFQIGFEAFLKFASANAADKSSIRCPCTKRCNHLGFTIRVIKDHVYFNGILTNYFNWKHHGEPSTMNAASEIEFETVEMSGDVDSEDSEGEEISSDSNEFLRFVEDGDKPLYPGCTKTTKLNGLVQTFNLKAKHGMTDACYSDMLLMIGGLLPEGNEVPASLYEAKKTLAVLGMEYEKIHACPNDCILYRGRHAEATSCPTYLESRYKMGEDQVVKVKIPAKVLWYFPIIPRFRRMFQSTKTAKALTWHATDRKIDAFMRHPANSPNWKNVDTKWPEFGKEASSLSSRYSCWPVILVTYNLPPWLYMKRKYLMLSLLIAGPKQPGNDIDVYLQPLIDDLKKLWQGVERVYGAIREEYFTLKAVLLWTINDFPAYGNLSGCVTKGYKGCHVCADECKPKWLKHSKKMAFMRHCQFLPRHHPYRKQAAAFDNTIEEDVSPSPLSGEEVLLRVEGLDNKWGKTQPKRQTYKGRKEDRPCWKKKSIL